MEYFPKLECCMVRSTLSPIFSQRRPNSCPLVYVTIFSGGWTISFCLTRRFLEYFVQCKMCFFSTVSTTWNKIQENTSWFARNIRWYGRLISEACIRNYLWRLYGLLNMKLPETDSHLQQFIFVRPWVKILTPKFSDLIAPNNIRLRNILKIYNIFRFSVQTLIISL